MISASSEQSLWPLWIRLGPGETRVVHRSWQVPRIPRQPSMSGSSISHRKRMVSLSLRGRLHVGGWVRTSLLGTVHFTPDPRCLHTKPPLEVMFPCFHWAPVPGFFHDASPEHHPTFLHLSFLPRGVGGSSFTRQSATIPLHTFITGIFLGGVTLPIPINSVTRWGSNWRGKRGSTWEKL